MSRLRRCNVGPSFTMSNILNNYYGLIFDVPATVPNAHVKSRGDRGTVDTGAQWYSGYIFRNLNRGNPRLRHQLMPPECLSPPRINKRIDHTVSILSENICFSVTKVNIFHLIAKLMICRRIMTKIYCPYQ